MYFTRGCGDHYRGTQDDSAGNVQWVHTMDKKCLCHPITLLVLGHALRGQGFIRVVAPWYVDPSQREHSLPFLPALLAWSVYPDPPCRLDDMLAGASTLYHRD
jgi:hypothetical protein